MSQCQQDHPHPTRREFARAIAVLAATPLAAGVGTAVAEQVKPADTFQAVAHALEEIAQARYGKFLTKAEQKALQRSLRSILRSAEHLKRFPLKNSDEPAVLFRADVP